MAALESKVAFLLPRGMIIAQVIRNPGNHLDSHVLTIRFPTKIVNAWF